MENRIEEIEVSLNTILVNFNVDEHKNLNSKGNNQIKLPEIPLPTFSGKYEDWNIFKTEFNNIVTSNKNLTDIQKLHYLHSALKGDAKMLQTPEDSFESLFEALEKRFENKKIMVDIHVKSILEYEKLTVESSRDLRKLVDIVNKNIRALKNLNFERNNFSDILLTTIILQKLDRESRKQFELSINSSEVPSFDDLMLFLEKRSQTLESINKNISVKPKATIQNKKGLFLNANSVNKSCVICKLPHNLYKCDKFVNMNFDERFNLVKENKLCLNCLNGKHFTATCKSKYSCATCGKRHSTFLHRGERISTPTLVSPPSDCEAGGSQSQSIEENLIPKTSVFSSCLLNTRKTVILSTANILVRNERGQFVEGKALLDTGAQANFVTCEFARKLGIKKRKTCTPVSGLNGSAMTLNYKINSLITNRERSFMKELEFLITPKITDLAPVHHINVIELNIPPGINLADQNFTNPGKIDLLLGNECFFEFLKSDRIRLPSQPLLFQDTVFGYVASGVVNDSQGSQFCGLTTGNNIEEMLRKFWEVETVENIHCPLSDEEQFCEDHFQRTHYRESNGQYVVSMPMKNVESLGESKTLAEKRLNQLWQRLYRQPEMKVLYTKFMQEYKDLNHMEIIENLELESKCYYLPHHGIYKPEKSTTKLRVVFNASAATTSGHSLNDVLLKGKIPQQELFCIMLRFRKHRYAFTADVEKMYRQILIHPSQRDHLRIVWKDDIDAPQQIYNLNTITYGTANAPYLATRTVKQLAFDEQKDLPLAASVALADIYMDDILSGEASLQGAKELQLQLIELFHRGSMQLHKWCANDPELLTIQNHEREYEFTHQLEDNPIKTLGVLWNPKPDSFTFKVSTCERDCYTKRDVLSHISRIFDPLGIIGPVVSKAKIFMQKLWLQKLDWHDYLPESLNKEWLSFVSSLPEIQNLKVPRYIFENDHVILHGFADASSLGYGAAIYVQSIPAVGSPSANLLCSKSRVAPIKPLTIPRLELSACLLLSQLVNKVLPALDTKIERVILWSDSMIALAWIKKSPHQLKTFVSNRVAAIQHLTKSYEWKHIASESNPADLISRGMNANEIATCEKWWHGPKLLQEELVEEATNSEINYECKILPGDYESELKPESNISSFSIVKINSLLVHLLNISNNYMTLIRIFSFVLRYISNIKPQKPKVKGPLSKQELTEAELSLIREVQKGEFSLDILAIQKESPVPAKSQLKNLNAFLDSKQILRVGGRLINSQLSFDAKFPIILPAKHKLTRLIMEYHHLKYFHLSPQALLNSVRQKFWPISGRNLARRVSHECVSCFKQRPVVAEQIMGNLPSERVNPEFTFNNSGIDFCGPFFIKAKNQRRVVLEKMYVAVFVCFATKAIHLELVSDLSSVALIATLKRFFARRGKCSQIFTDNATNFVGARSELKKLYKLVRHPEQELSDFLASEDIEWKFIPPRAPHFGGLWEAGVKSFKHHLKRTLGNSKLTVEEFLTVIIQIEGILNSRPITPLSSDADDLNALTPGHFLIGRPITAPVEPELVDKADNRLSRWERLTKMVQIIWKRWQQDYLSHLHERTKWQFVKNNIRPGTIVLVREDNLPICQWVIGKIEEVIPGKDGKIRVVMVKTPTGTFKRPISRISILPIRDNN